MHIQFNFNNKCIDQAMLSRDRRSTMLACLMFTFVVPLLLCFQMSALSMDIPPKDMQYVQADMFETNYYRSGRHQRYIAGLRLDVIEKGKDRDTSYYLAMYAIEGDAEALRDRINHPRSQECVIGYVEGVEQQLTTDREKRFVVSLECEGEVLLEPQDTVPDYRERAKERLCSALIWLAFGLLMTSFAAGLIQIHWRKQ